MEIREKILFYFTKNDISFTEIGKELGISDVSVGHYLHGKRKMPMDFLVWFIRKYNPDLKNLFSEDDNVNLISEEKASYESKSDKAELILKEMKKVLKKHL